MQSVVSIAKDKAEAVKLGLEKLGVSEESVIIEVLKEKEKGFRWFRSNEVTVKLTKKADAETAANSVLSDIDIKSDEKIEGSHLEQVDNLGKAWVKDGILSFESSPEKSPTVRLKPGVSLYRDGEIVSEKEIILTEQEHYELKVEDEEKATEWKISLDAKKLKADLYVKPGYQISRTLPNVSANYRIEIAVNEQQETKNTLKMQEVIEDLERIGVKRDADRSIILEAIAAMEPGSYEIVTGVKPNLGKHGWVELKVDIQAHEGVQEKAGGQVDFRETKIIPNVEKDQIIGVIHPPIPSEVGYTVTNEEIPVQPTLPVTVTAGNGVIVNDDKIIALASGRPQVQQKGQNVKVTVISTLSHATNVDLTSGNLRFAGDIEVLGEVGEQMLVEAQGNVTIHKTVKNAKVIAQGNVTIYGNIISSEISVGKNSMQIAELSNLLGIINQHVEKIIEVIRQISASPAFKGGDIPRGELHKLIRQLMGQKFKDLPPLIKRYIESVKSEEASLADESWGMISVTLSKVFLSLKIEVTSLDQIIQLSKKMAELHEVSAKTVNLESLITIPNALSSTLYCSGNIQVIGQGSVNSKIHAEGTLKISGRVRGGEIYGGLGMEIDEAGAESGTATFIAVPKDKTIRLRKVMEGTKIQIGQQVYSFRETKHQVHAHLDENNRIIIS